MAARKTVNVIEDTEVTGPVESVTSVTVDGIVEVAVSVAYKFNVGNFENADVFGSAKGRFPENTDMNDVADYLLSNVYKAMGPSVALAQAICDARKIKSLAHMLDIE